MAVTAITGYSCRLVTVGNQNCGNTSPDSCKHDTDNGNKIGDENDICPTEPSWKKHDKYDQRDVDGKSNKVIK
jgi:hypothetical protein